MAHLRRFWILDLSELHEKALLQRLNQAAPAYGVRSLVHALIQSDLFQTK